MVVEIERDNLKPSDRETESLRDTEKEEETELNLQSFEIYRAIKEKAMSQKKMKMARRGSFMGL